MDECAVRSNAVQCDPTSCDADANVTALDRRESASEAGETQTTSSSSPLSVRRSGFRRSATVSVSDEELTVKELRAENKRLRSELRHAMTCELRMVEKARLLAVELARIRRASESGENDSEPTSPKGTNGKLNVHTTQYWYRYFASGSSSE